MNWFSLWLYRRSLIRAVGKHGWTATPVGDGSPGAWTYSIGFASTLSAPEIVVSGVPLGITNDLMWEAFRQIRGGKLVLEDRLAWNLGEGWRPVWRKVDPDWIEDGRLHFALWHREHMIGHRHDLQAYQLVFYDVDSGLFPWDEGFPEDRRQGQVDFYSPMDSSAES